MVSPQEAAPLTEGASTPRRRIVWIAIATITLVVACVSLLPLQSGTNPKEENPSNAQNAALLETRHKEPKEQRNASTFSCHEIMTDIRPEVSTYVGCREACSTIVTLPGMKCHGFSFLWKSKQCSLQLAIVFDEAGQGEITLQRNSPKERSLYCTNTRQDMMDKADYQCLRGDQVKLSRKMKANKCKKRCNKKRTCNGYLHNPNDRSCTLFLKRTVGFKYEPNNGERCFLQDSQPPVTCPCFSQQVINDAVDGIVNGIYEAKDKSCQAYKKRKGVTFDPSPNGQRYSGFEIDQSGANPTCILSGDQYFTLTRAEAKQCMIHIENACSDLVAQTECPSDCFSDQDMNNALSMVQTGEAQLGASSCSASEDSITFTYNKIEIAGRRLAQVPGEYIFDTFGVDQSLSMPSCLRSDTLIGISSIEYLKCRSLIEDTCSKFQRPSCPCFTSNHVEYISSEIQKGEIGFDSENSCIDYPDARQIVYTDSRERVFKVNSRLPSCVTPFDETVLMSTAQAEDCLYILDDVCAVLKDEKGLEATCPCFTESDVSSAYEENSLVSEFSCDQTSESSLTLSYENPNSDFPMKFGVYESPELSCSEQDTRRFTTPSEHNACKRILNDTCSKLEFPACPCFNSKQIAKEVSNINNGITEIVPTKSCSRYREDTFGLYSTNLEDYSQGDVTSFSNPIYSVNESSCRALDFLILSSELELRTCRAVLKDACENLELPECPCFSSDELNLKILETQNEFNELESCETDDDSSTFFVTIEPYFTLARGQRPGTKLRWNYDVRSNSVGLTCSRLDTNRVISPLEWKSCETKLQSVCEEVRKPKSETCPCFSSLELQQAVESVESSILIMDTKKSCGSQPGSKEMFFTSDSEETHYKVDHEALSCLSPLLEEELDISDHEAAVCQNILENACSELGS